MSHVYLTSGKEYWIIMAENSYYYYPLRADSTGTVFIKY